MIQIKQGDLLTAKGVIVHGCNAQGVMGSGVAKQIKDKWPMVYKTYSIHCKRMNIMGTFDLLRLNSEQFIVSMITQEYYGRNKNIVYVDYDAVKLGFRTLNTTMKDRYPFVDTINFPLIGCGLANGDWKIVSNIIDEELDNSFNKILWLRDE